MRGCLGWNEKISITLVVKSGLEVKEMKGCWGVDVVWYWIVFLSEGGFMKFAVIFVLQIFIVCVSSSQLLSSFLIFAPWLITDSSRSAVRRSRTWSRCWGCGGCMQNDVTGVFWSMLKDLGNADYGTVSLTGAWWIPFIWWMFVRLNFWFCLLL